MPGEGVRTIAAELGDWLASLQVADLPEFVRADACRRLVDQVGVCIVGARSESAAAVRRVAERFGGHPQATVIGSAARLPAPLAGLVNGTAGHAADFDDMHGAGAVHISSVAVPAALAASEALDLSAARCLLAMVGGAEVALRIASGAPPHQFHRRGLHRTGVAGPFAAAGAGALALRLDGCTAAQALGLAGSRSSGLMQTLIDGSWVKQLHAGWAAQAGITCAWLAAEGVTGPPEVVEGRFGVFHSLLHGDEATFRLERITAGLGDKWLLPSTTFKPWPNGVWNHASMEGTMTILEREGIQAEEIERIDCRVPPVCIPLVCEPREAKLNPRSPYHMKFSLPYSVAMLAVRRRVGVEDYTAEVLADPAVRGLAGRVHCHPDSTLRTETFPARVQLTARDGRVFSSDVPAQLGSPNHPMSVEQHRQKFRYNVRGSLGDQATERLLGELENAWEAPSVRELLRLAAGRSTVPA